MIVDVDVQDWSETRSLALAERAKAEEWAAFGDAPYEYLEGSSVAKRHVADSLVDLIGACPDRDGRGLMARMLAEKLVTECLKAEGKDFVQLAKLILDYTDGTPVHRVPMVSTDLDTERVVTIVQRGAEYVSERG